MNLARKMAFAGSVTAVLMPRLGFYANGLPKDLALEHRLRGQLLEAKLRVRAAAKGLARGLAHGTGILGVGRLYASVLRCGCAFPEAHVGRVCPAARIEHLGLLCTKVITNAGVTYLRDDWNLSGNHFSNFNFHGCGTGTNAENVTDTALQTEQTTNLNPASTRATGTRSVPASNQFASVGTLTFAGTAAITEQGMFTQAATGGGTLWDRSVFAAINVNNGDSIQFTYTCTLSAGG